MESSSSTGYPRLLAVGQFFFATESSREPNITWTSVGEEKSTVGPLRLPSTTEKENTIVPNSSHRNPEPYQVPKITPVTFIDGLKYEDILEIAMNLLTTKRKKS